MLEVEETDHRQQIACPVPQRWTCWRCFKWIGEVRGDEVTIKRHNIDFVGRWPATQVCPHCRTINRWDENGPT